MVGWMCYLVGISFRDLIEIWWDLLYCYLILMNCGNERCFLKKFVKKFWIVWKIVVFFLVESWFWKRMEDLGILEWSDGLFFLKIKK